MTLVFGNTLKNIFLQATTVRPVDDLNLSLAKIENCIKLMSSLLENQVTPQKFTIIPKLSVPSKV